METQVLCISSCKCSTFLRIFYRSKTKKVKVIFYSTLLFPRERLLLKGSPGFARLFFWYEERIDKDEYGAHVESWWQGKTKVLGENTVPVQLSPPQMSHGLIWDWTLPTKVRSWRLTVWAMTLPLEN